MWPISVRCNPRAKPNVKAALTHQSKTKIIHMAACPGLLQRRVPRPERESSDEAMLLVEFQVRSIIGSCLRMASALQAARLGAGRDLQ